MPEGLRSPTIFTPKSISEALAIKNKNRDARFWAGGTFIMSRPSFYPNVAQKDIISLSGIPELEKIYHVDRYIEAGAMVTIQQLLTMGRYYFSKELYAAIDSLGSTIIRSQATVGGALCTHEGRLSLSCFLSAIGAQAEIRIVSKNPTSRWIPVAKLYDRKGTFLYANNALLTRVRIPAEGSNSNSSQVQCFRIVSSPMHQSQQSVIFGMTYSINQGNIVQPSVCVVFPSSCFYMSQDFDNLISSISLPITPERIMKTSQRLESDLKAASPNANPLQLERASRILEVLLYDMNTKYLAG